MDQWLLVDDKEDEARLFADALSERDTIAVDFIRATEVEKLLASGNLRPSGVLMDVDLSSETGMRSTGPGIAQNIRVAQHREAVPSFPVIRFSARARVLESIGQDSSSDDVFDLKFEKDGLSDRDRQANARKQMLGVGLVYQSCAGTSELKSLLNVNEEIWASWGHPAFAREFASADRTYLRAAKIVRMLSHSGILVGEQLLAIRLGIDRKESKGWADLQQALAPFAFTGAGAEYFPRWWARGIEDWWASLGSETPLGGASISDRVSKLAAVGYDLTALTMPKGSPGDRPWRHCSLTLEDTGEIVPVDPTKAVKLTPRETLPVWLDPMVATLGAAVRQKADPRIDPTELARLQKFIRS